MPFYSTAQASNARDAIDPGVIKSSAELLFQLLIDGDKAFDRESARQHAAQMTDRDVLDFLHSRSHLELRQAEEELFSNWARTAVAVGRSVTCQA